MPFRNLVLLFPQPFSLTTGKIIHVSLLFFSVINFGITLYFKTYIKLKRNYIRSLKLTKQNESY